jgi:xylose isomerase
MRTYLALAERARHFDELPEVQEALAAAGTPDLAIPPSPRARLPTR